jgi:hypothetical protein
LVKQFQIFGARSQLAIYLPSEVRIVPKIGPTRLGFELRTSQKQFFDTQVHPRFIYPTVQVGKFVGIVPHAP